MTTIEMTEEAESLCQAGKAAWTRLKATTKDWDDWMAVGEALVAGRDWAKADSNSTTANGYRYNQSFSRWLDQYGFGDTPGTNQPDRLDPSDRAKLLKVMESRAEIEPWRARLPLTERLQQNHPRVVLNKWEAFRRREGTAPKLKHKAQSQKERSIELEMENTALREEVKEREEQPHDRDFDALPFDLKTLPVEDIVARIVGDMDPERLKELYAELGKKIKNAKQPVLKGKDKEGVVRQEGDSPAKVRERVARANAGA